MVLPVFFYVCIVTSDRTDLRLVSVQNKSHFTYYLLLCFASIIFYLGEILINLVSRDLEGKLKQLKDIKTVAHCQ